MSAEASSFGALLKQYRTAAGLTQEALAERAGLSARAISDLERDLNRTPRHDTRDLLAQALHLPPRKRALLVAAANPAVDTSAALEPPTQVPHNLPVAPTPLIGRDQDINRATRLLERPEVRLLTLIGPSGVGKTRLALQLAEDVLERYDEGVWFVALASIHEPALVAPAIAQALGLRESGGQTALALLKDALHQQQTLLLLDNFEQVAGAAPLVAELLSACPRLKVLVTSRATLHLRGEYEWAVAPLDQEPAVALFLQRAQAVRPNLELSAEALQAITAICQRLDRLPLAIELAAARMKTLPAPALLARLSSRLPLLTGGALDLPERQRTMRTAVAWSYELLSPVEQRLFRSLAVFADGCTLEAAETICAEAEKTAAASALEGLTALVDQSLLCAEIVDGGPRFAMLEIIGEYALEQLQAQQVAETLRRRHAEYYTQVAEEVARVGPNQDARDAQILQESANIRAAIAWAREHRESGLGLRLATACGRIWYIRGRVSELTGWFDDLLTLDAAAGERAAAPAVRVMALYGLGQIAMDQGQYDRVEAVAREGLALAEQIGDESGRGNALSQLGTVAEARGDLPQAAQLLEEGLTHCRKAGDIGGQGRALISLGHIYRALGDYARATSYFEESLEQLRTIHLTWGIANILTSLGHLAREQGDYPRAITRYRESLALHRLFGNQGYIAWCFEGMAAAFGAQKQPERAAQLCAAAATLREAAHAPRPPAEQQLFEQTVAVARSALGEAAFQDAWSAGEAYSLEEAISAALEDTPDHR